MLGVVGVSGYLTRGVVRHSAAHGVVMKRTDMDKIVRLRCLGVSYDAIAERMGISHATISNAMKGVRRTRAEGDTMRLIEKQEARVER